MTWSPINGSMGYGERGNTMKRLILAGLLALGLTAVSQQQASAWNKVSFGAGFNFCWECTGWDWCCSFHCNPPPSYSHHYYQPYPVYEPPHYPYPYPYPHGYGYQAPAAGQGGFTAPQPTPQGNDGKEGSNAPRGAQPSSAAYYGSVYSYGGGYGFGQVPSYWQY
jgi:hypothetical protein